MINNESKDILEPCTICNNYWYADGRDRCNLCQEKK